MTGVQTWLFRSCAIMDSEKVWRAGRRFAPRFFVKITVPGLEVWGGYFLYDPKENPTATANNTRPANPMTVSISMASPHFRGEIKPPASVHFSRLPPRSVRKRERHRRSLTRTTMATPRKHYSTPNAPGGRFFVLCTKMLPKNDSLFPASWYNIH